MSEVRLDNAYLRPLQVSTFFEFTSAKNFLSVLDIHGNNLSGVEAEKLAVTANKLSEINLNQTKISGVQCRELFKKMQDFTKLTVLRISDVDLSSVPANVLAEAVNKVNRILHTLTLLRCSILLSIYCRLTMWNCLGQN